MNASYGDTKSLGRREETFPTGNLSPFTRRHSFRPCGAHSQAFLLQLRQELGLTNLEPGALNYNFVNSQGMHDKYVLAFLPGT